MSQALLTSAFAKNTSAADAFLEISKVYLSNIEELSAHQLNTAREMVEGCSSITKALNHVSTSKDWDGFLSLLTPPWSQWVAYSRGTYDIIAKTQAEMVKVVATQLARQHMTSSSLTSWRAMTDMYTKGVEGPAASSQKPNPWDGGFAASWR
jgi:hypothetical protein